MRGLKIWLGTIFTLIFSLGVFVSFFYFTGGAGLSRIVFNYLIPDLPDKKYSWQDFRYKRESQKISGFYAYGNDESFNIWTLSGLKKFYHKTGTSVYSFRDTCAIVKQITAKDTSSSLNPENIFFGLNEWNSVMKKEYFVTVQSLGKENGREIVDKVWSVSGKYKILGRIEGKVCD